MSATADGEELFTHTVTPLTAGDLRKALEGIPEDFPVLVFTAEEPGGRDLAPEQVPIHAAPWAHNGMGSGTPDFFEIGCEFPSGRYHRRSRD
jgi:hypothetical protein